MTISRWASGGVAVWAPLTVALALTVGYLVAAPHTSDLAAQLARAELFRRSGYVPFWTGWFGGIPTVSYSLITPPLLGWLGPVLLGGLSIFATGVVVVALLRDAPRPSAGAIFFVIAATLDVISGRTTFAVGAVLALAALLAAERRRPIAGALLAALATAASPVAGVLLLVAVAALLMADPARRRVAAGLGAAVVITLVVLEVLAGGAGSGYEPLSRTSTLMAVGTALLVVIVPVSRRVRAGAVVAVAFLLLVYFIHSPIGANATRIAVLGAAPTMVAAARLPRRWLVLGVAVASLLPLAQLHNDYVRSRVPDFSRAFVAPLLVQLEAQPDVVQYRVELVDTATRFPSTYVLPHVALARGWERQTDEARNPIFYDSGRLTPSTFHAFLARNAVGYVAVPVGVKLDFGSIGEELLIGSRLPYLHRIWGNANWRLYAVDAPTPIVAAPATVASLADTGLTLTVPSSGSYVVRMQWSPYLVVDGGRVSRAPDGDVILHLTSAGSHRLHAVWRWP
jgi:hypothetical protein